MVAPMSVSEKSDGRTTTPGYKWSLCTYGSHCNVSFIFD